MGLSSGGNEYHACRQAVPDPFGPVRESRGELRAAFETGEYGSLYILVKSTSNTYQVSQVKSAVA